LLTPKKTTIEFPPAITTVTSYNASTVKLATQRVPKHVSIKFNF
jgi:hypothetical protein